MSLIKGIHHIALKCQSTEEYDRTTAFYRDVLGLSEARSWNNGIMFDTGAGLIEIFNNADIKACQGAIRHVALRTDCTDDCVEAVIRAGYEVFRGPEDIIIPSDPPFPARIAFCRGPLGEEIEFFQEK